MKNWMRPRTERKGRRWLLTGVLLAVCAVGPAQRLLAAPAPLLMGEGSSSSYLGVDLADVDAQKAQALKLKEPRGAVITLIDHDAPAGQVGLRAGDVVVAFNGQPVAGAEPLRKLLRETPAGRKISLTIVREGQEQTLEVELADRKAVEHEVWNQIGPSGGLFSAEPGMKMLPEGGAAADAPVSSGFHLPFFGGSLNVGLTIEPLTAQMAEVLGVKSGLMVKQVTRRSAASAAGLRALDVILKVGMSPVTTTSGWERAMRRNQGKSVQVTVLRDRKLQTITLLVDSRRRS